MIIGFLSFCTLCLYGGLGLPAPNAALKQNLYKLLKNLGVKPIEYFFP